MSDVADALIDIYESTPDDSKPEVAPVLAGIMREQMAIDRLNTNEVNRLKADHAREVEKINAEIDGYEDAIRSLEGE